MNKNLAIFGLAVSASYVFAVGSLWSISEGKNYSYQVQTPEVVQCTGGDPNSMDDYGAACYKSTGGWWFAYDATSSIAGTSATVSPADKNADGTWKLITTDETDGSILPGGNLDATKGIFATMSTTGVDGEHPGVVGIGFNWAKAETAVSITAHGGFCLAYSSTGSTVQMELGWDSKTYGDDTWFYELPEGAKSLDLPWSMFKQEGWDKDHSTTVATATDYSVSIKFRIKNGTSTEMSNTFAIQELGWQGECGSATPVAGIASVNQAAAAKVMLSNRTLSIAGLSSAANVEVVNLRGQVVASKVLSGSASMNLSSLDAGVYMVRVQGKAVSYSQKVILK
jgi:hypothetical protein